MRASWTKIARRALAVVATALLALSAAGVALAAPEDPIFVYTPHPTPPGPPIPPPVGYVEGPCGLAVAPSGNFYVSDYYHHTVDAFTPSPGYQGQIKGVDPLDGPCGLAFDSTGNLYLNSYHRYVARYPDGPGGPVDFGAPATIDSATPTGVAADPASDVVYVDNRTHISAYDSSGTPVEVSGEPLRIGVGSLGDGYGIAVSGFPATAGRLYVPDAASGTVKVYDPALDAEDPVAEIDGEGVPGGGFVSLRDSAVAVDRVSGKVYVADNLQPAFAEHPEAAIYVFDSAGAYLGRLKHNVYDGFPPGLAVDNSAQATQGRVYVTSGNTDFASVYAYGPNAETDTVLSPVFGESTPILMSAATVRAPGAAATPVVAPPATASEVAQKGSLRMNVSAGFTPRALPREGTAPIRVRVGGQVSALGDADLPQLKTMRIEFNRSGRLEDRGLPTCPAAKIRVASSARALRACRDALVGEGSFEADVVLAGQDPYPTRGRLLLFNAKGRGGEALIGQIYSARPFATSFLIPFSIDRAKRGAFGTTITASLPDALGNWGYVTAIDLELSRTYRAGGERRSFLAAGCPAPKGFPGALFPLARVSFSFDGGKELGSTMVRNCKVR